MNKCVQGARMTCFTLYKLFTTLTLLWHIYFVLMKPSYIVENLAILAQNLGGITVKHIC